MKKPVPEPASEWPMRLNKYLAREGIATRRAADELIARGRVRINGAVAKLGDKVEEGDTVSLAGATTKKQHRYFAYHKPAGVITHSPQRGETDAATAAKMRGVEDIFPVGRLDKDSSGLLILTDDGRVTDRLLSPRYTHEKEYRVRTKDPLRDSFRSYMENGVDIEGYVTAPCTVRRTGPKSFTITLTEGKKHQIRRMVAALHNQVTELVRTRIMNIRLENLAPGSLRPIEGDELATFLSALGLG